MSSSKLVVTGASEHGHGKVQEPEDGKGYSTTTLRSLSDLLFSPLFFFYWLQSAAPLKSFNCSLPFGWLFFLFFRGWRVFTLFGPAAFALAVCCGSMTPFPTTWNLQTGCLALLCLFHPVQYALWFSYMSLYNIIYIYTYVHVSVVVGLWHDLLVFHWNFRSSSTGSPGPILVVLPSTFCPSFGWKLIATPVSLWIVYMYTHCMCIYIYTYDTYPSLFVIRFLCKSHFMFFLQAAFEEAHLGKMERFDAGSRHQHQLQSSTEIET